MSETDGWSAIEDFEMFKALEKLCDEIWDVVLPWRPFVQDTLDKQLVRAVDSVGANLAEGDGRYHHRDKLQFYYIARGSVKEGRYWLRRARARHLVTEKQAEDFGRRLDSTWRWINTMISQRRRWVGEVREERAEYDA